MTWKINENAIPTLAVGFSRGMDALGDAIAFFRGGVTAVKDKSFPTHCFLFTRDNGRLFASEETASGLRENSLANYCDDSNRIVAVYFWNGFNDAARVNDVLRDLSDIRANGDYESKYDFKGLLSFLPGIGKWFKPDKRRKWCSKSVSDFMFQHGAVWTPVSNIAPDQLLKKMQNNDSCKAILNYYL